MWEFCHYVVNFLNSSSSLSCDSNVEINVENACLEPGVESLQSAACQRFIMSSWREGYARSLYSSWMLAELTCQYYGQCQGNNKYWGCTEVRSPAKFSSNFPTEQ